MVHSFLKRTIFRCVVCSFAVSLFFLPQSDATAQNQQYSSPPSQVETSIVNRLKQIRDAFDFQDTDYSLRRDSSKIWLHPKKHLSISDVYNNLQYIPGNTFVTASLAQIPSYEKKIFEDSLIQFHVDSRVNEDGTQTFRVDSSKSEIILFLDDLHKRGISTHIPIIGFGCEIGPLNSTLRSKNLVKIIQTHMKRSSEKNSAPFILRTNRRSQNGLYLTGKDEKNSVFTVEEEKEYLGEKE